MDDDVEMGTDYSDFEYQFIDYQHTATYDSGGQISGRTDAIATFEPLAGVGGLATNEVAELVYMDVTANVEWEDEDDDQNVATQAEFRGVVGANLENSRTQQLPFGQGASETNVITNTTDTDILIEADSKTDDRIFTHFQTLSGAPFDDETNGAGGNADADGFRMERPWRQVTGRGPVLDSNDDIGVNSRLVVNDSIIGCVGQVRAHLVWDVAEVDDAGRAFSVPMDD
jgi:hypothetical protein